MTCQHCSIIPSYILKDIAASSNVPQNVRDIATKSLADKAAIHHARSIAQGTDLGPSAALPAAGPAPRPLHRRIHNAQQRGFRDLPGILVFEDGNAAAQTLADESVQNVHDHFQNVFRFYREVFNRNSYDGNGAKLLISVHFDGDPNPGYANAFWLPDRDPHKSQWAFGDGDFVLFDNLTNILDISAHEFTHAVVEHTGILPYHYQSGALNESMADVFGSMIKQYFHPDGRQEAEDADWLIGEGLWLLPAGRGGRALRDMEHPGTAFNIVGVTSDSQTAHMNDYADLPDTEDGDFGGVHINSGIPNRAFVLVAKRLRGFSWEVAGPIWYASLTDPSLRAVFTRNGRPIDDHDPELIPLTENTFRVFADLTIRHARAHSPNAETVVKDAWREVGVLH